MKGNRPLKIKKIVPYVKDSGNFEEGSNTVFLNLHVAVEE
jgi:hypothetical protein